MKLSTLLFLIFTFSAYLNGIGQSNNQNALEIVKANDIRNLLISDSIQVEINQGFIKRPEPLGFIGEDYQRFHIKFLQCNKNPENPLEYIIYGKTMVKNNICDFVGLLKVKEASLESLQEYNISDYKAGIIKGEYMFFENQSQKHSGIFMGKFNLGIIYNIKNNNIQYDALFYVADGFENNSFIGSWSPYYSLIKRTCNWGDFRIPNSENLDGGASEFIPSEKFLDKGWANYYYSYFVTNDYNRTQKAQMEEEKEWWLDCKEQ